MQNQGYFQFEMIESKSSAADHLYNQFSKNES